MVKAAGTGGLLMRKLSNKVILQLPSKREVALDPECMATVGMYTCTPSLLLLLLLFFYL